MKRIIVLLCVISFIGTIGIVSAQTITPPAPHPSEWFMAGANPQRTSHVDSTPTNQTEIPGKLYPEWFIPIEPYIPYGWQLIIADDTIFVSTARGLYAIDINAGDLYSQNPNNPDKPWLKWVFPTELPLGQSPTVVKNSQGEYIVYVGGFDKKVHAIKANPDPSKVEIDPLTSQRVNKDIVWTFDAQEYWNNTEPQAQHIAAGFNTNPLVIDNKVFLGNRDGYLYALDQTNGNLLWYFKTDGPILFSAAASPDNSTIYFASNDMHGYAVRASDGKLDAQTIPGTWKTEKFPGSGFFSWWPVYYHHPTKGDRVIFAGSNNYTFVGSPGVGLNFLNEELHDLYTPDELLPENTDSPLGSIGTVPGDWEAGSVTMDGSRVLDYLAEPTSSERTNDPAGVLRQNHKPWRKTYVILNLQTGEEEETAPITYAGVNDTSGTRFPAVLGGDGLLYQMTNTHSTPNIARGTFSGITLGSTFIKLTAYREAVDEEVAFSSGGDTFYYSHISDDDSGSFSVHSKPNSTIPGEKLTTYYLSGSLKNEIAYDQAYEGDPLSGNWAAFGGLDGVYGKVGNQNPPIPYKGKVYTHKGNSLIAFSINNTKYALQPAQTMSVTQSVSLPSRNTIQQRLIGEVQKIIGPCLADQNWINCHLKPAYFISPGMTEAQLDHNDLDALWHHASDPFYFLIRAQEVLPDTIEGNILRNGIKDYLTYEYGAFPPYVYNHIGWKTGVDREQSIKPPEYQASIDTDTIYKSTGNTTYNFGPQFRIYSFDYATNPNGFYALWQYAKMNNFTQAEVRSWFDGIITNATIGARGKFFIDSFNTIPSANALAERPFVANAYIAGYIGYLNLAKMAGYTDQELQDRQSILSDLLSTRFTTFSQHTPYDIAKTTNSDDTRNQELMRTRVLNIARNFIYLVPELGDYIQSSSQICSDGRNIYDCVVAALNRYNSIAPYWFVSEFAATYNEGSIQQIYDTHALFQAKAQILKEPYEELVKHLDVPAVERGDLFYIDNLVSLLEATGSATTSPTPTRMQQPGDTDADGDVDIFDYNAVITDFGKTGGQGFSNADFDDDGDVDIFDYNVVISNFGR